MAVNNKIQQHGSVRGNTYIEHRDTYVNAADPKMLAMLMGCAIFCYWMCTTGMNDGRASALVTIFAIVVLAVPYLTERDHKKPQQKADSSPSHKHPTPTDQHRLSDKHKLSDQISPLPRSDDNSPPKQAVKDVDVNLERLNRVGLANAENIDNRQKVYKIPNNGADRAERPFFVAKILPTNGRHTKTEVDLWERLHPNQLILPLLAIRYIDDHVVLKSEYAKNGNLTEFRHEHRQLWCDKHSRLFTNQLIEAIQYLHQSKIAHMDLKGDNILVQDCGKQIWLCDFGLAVDTTNKDQIFTEYRGTKRFMAPEVQLGKEYDPKKADIYSLGVVVKELRRPSSDDDGGDEKGCADDGGDDRDSADDGTMFIRSLMHQDPAQRPTIDEAKNNRWLKDKEEYQQQNSLKATQSSVPSSLTIPKGFHLHRDDNGVNVITIDNGTKIDVPIKFEEIVKEKCVQVLKEWNIRKFEDETTENTFLSGVLTDYAKQLLEEIGTKLPKPLKYGAHVRKDPKDVMLAKTLVVSQDEPFRTIFSKALTFFQNETKALLPQDESELYENRLLMITKKALLSTYNHYHYDAEQKKHDPKDKRKRRKLYTDK